LGFTCAIDSTLYDTHHRSRHYERRCRQPSDWCLDDLPVSEVTAAIQQRLGSVRPAEPAE